MTYSLDLLFQRPSKNDMLGPAHAYIYVKTYTCDKNGPVLISPDYVTLREVEEQIERLKKELEVRPKKSQTKIRLKIDLNLRVHSDAPEGGA